ncbi:uncharacterized protein LOC132619743 [Lycium barbarum]|uniref:uncharacterized protein LOC132619743 n=1 Tax=Lycium barbarum TaxID=112863 RepID=UPI00293EACC6|nr:uncharacterized protein LOC132619743 [Lycium barbarum]
MAHIMSVKGNNLKEKEIESILIKKFSETFTKGALTWYSRFPEHLIGSYAILADTFIKAHMRARNLKTGKTDILSISQGESELIRDFVTLFQKERILLPAVPNEWVAEAFNKGLNPLSSDASRKLKENLLEFQATTWEDVHNRYESKIWV